MPTIVEKIVDPDNAPGTNYTKLQSCETANFGCSNANFPLVDERPLTWCRSSAGTADGPCSIAGETTGVNHYVDIRAMAGHEARKDGISTAIYRAASDDASIFEINVNFCRITGLQVDLGATAATRTAFNVVSVSAGCDVRITSCYFRMKQSGAGTARAWYSADADCNCLVCNSIFYYASPISKQVIELEAAGTLVLYNSVVRAANLDVGIKRTAGTVTVVNTAVFNTTDDFMGTMTVTNCASDDGDGTNPKAPLGGDWNNEFVDPANGNFTLKMGGNLIAAGLGPTADAKVPTTDIEGQGRSGATCDIGADECGPIIGPDTLQEED